MGNTSSIQQNPCHEVLGKSLSELRQVFHEESEHSESVEIEKLANIRTRLLHQGTVLSNNLSRFTIRGDRQKVNWEVWSDCEKAVKSTVERSENLGKRISFLKKMWELFSQLVIRFQTERRALDCKVSHNRRGSAHF